jgi:concanavalin A-like lectin/glucanase superfamily protein
MSTLILGVVPLAGLAIVLLLTFVGCGTPFTSGTEPTEPTNPITIIEAVPSIVSHWPLGEANIDQPAADPVGGHVGQYQTHPDPGDPNQLSAPTSGTIEFLQPSLIASLSDDASIRVDGGYVEVPFVDALNTATFSLIAWVHADWTDSGSFRCVATSRESDAATGVGRGFALYANPTNQWEVWTGDGTSFLPRLTWSLPIALDKNEFLCVTCDGTTLKLYVDNEESAPATVSYKPSTANPLRIGDGAPERDPLFPFVGRMAHVAYFNDVLPPQTVANIFMAGVV